MAQAWTLGQVQGLQLAGRQLEHPLHVTVLLPRKGDSVNWFDEFCSASDVVHLEDFALLSYGKSLS